MSTEVPQDSIDQSWVEQTWANYLDLPLGDEDVLVGTMKNFLLADGLSSEAADSLIAGAKARVTENFANRYDEIYQKTL